MANTYAIVKTTARIPEYYIPAHSDERIMLPYLFGMLGCEFCRYGEPQEETIATYATYDEAMNRLANYESTVRPTVNKNGQRIKNDMTATEYQITELDEDGEASECLECAPYNYYQLWHETEQSGDRLIAIASDIKELYDKAPGEWGTARITNCVQVNDLAGEPNEDPRKAYDSSDFVTLDRWETRGEVKDYLPDDIIPEILDTLLNTGLDATIYLDETNGTITTDDGYNCRELLTVTQYDAEGYLGRLKDYTIIGEQNEDNAAEVIYDAYMGGDAKTVEEVNEALSNTLRDSLIDRI